MWIFLSDSFLSIVEDTTSDSDPGDLLVRARVRGDIESVFPSAIVREGEGWDYPFRATIPRAEVVSAIAARIESIDYPSFKDSVSDPLRQDMCSEVWELTRRFQERARE